MPSAPPWPAAMPPWPSATRDSPGSAPSRADPAPGGSLPACGWPGTGPAVRRRQRGGTSADMPVHVLLLRRARDGLGDPGAGDRRVDDAVLQPRVAAGHHLPGQPRVGRVGVVPELAEQLLTALPCLRAERVGQLDAGLPAASRFTPAIPAPGRVHLSPDAHRALREHLRPDVDDPAQAPLPALHPAHPPGHAVVRHTIQRSPSPPPVVSVL